MKNKIQAERLAEYETHKDAFASYADFVTARLKKSDLFSVMQAKIKRGSHL